MRVARPGEYLFREVPLVLAISSAFLAKPSAESLRPCVKRERGKPYATIALSAARVYSRLYILTRVV